MRIFLLLVVVLLSACSTKPERDPEYAPVEPEVVQAPQQNNGAIFQAGFERSWFENIRARRVGDILLITLAENTEASHSNSGSLSKSNTTTITNPTILGNALNFRIPNVNTVTGSNLGSTLSSSSDFSGDADNTQNNEFTGSISVTVSEVLSNGYLRIRGEKRIQMTGGNEYIRVAGLVRPEDIGVDNTVASTKIADATLTYVGDGRNQMATEMGWLAKFFISAIMPF